MVMIAHFCLICGLLTTQAPTSSKIPPGDSATETTVRAGLTKGHYPWYDPATDSVKSLNPPREIELPEWSWLRWLSGLRFLGNFVTLIGLMVVLVALVGLLIWFWQIYEPSDLEQNREEAKRGEPTRVDSLPEGMDGEFALADPWSEAIRRRARGDLAGAIICLFAHQLLTLSKLGLVRLAPGRTGRQLVKAVTDGDLRVMVQPTLRLFEVVYYGHRNPTVEEFDRTWMIAESFEKRVASGVIR